MPVGLSTVKISWKSDDQFSRKSPLKCQKTPKLQNFKCPYLPQMGADSRGTKTVFIGVPSAIMSIGPIGGAAPGSGKTPKVPHPQNVKTHFQKTWSSIRKKTLRYDTLRYARNVLCKFEPNRNSRNRLNRPTKFSVFGVWGKKGKGDPGMGPQKFMGPTMRICWWWKFGPKYTGSGRFLGVTKKVWGPLAPPLIGVEGRGWGQFVDLDEGYAHIKFRENRTSQSRDIPLWISVMLTHIANLSTVGRLPNRVLHHFGPLSTVHWTKAHFVQFTWLELSVTIVRKNGQKWRKTTSKGRFRLSSKILTKFRGKNELLAKKGHANFFSPFPSIIQDLSNVRVGGLCDEGFGGHSPRKWALDVNSENFKLPYLP